MRVKEFLRKAQFYLILSLGMYPACACIAVFLAPALLPYLWLHSLTFLLIGCLTLLLSRKPRLGVGILGCFALILPGVLLLQGSARDMILIFGVGYSALLLWSLQIGGWTPEQELSPGWSGICLTLLVIGCLLSYFEPRLQSLSGGIRICLLVFAFFAMCSMNRYSLQLASGGRGSISSGMRSKNLLLVVGMFALAMLVALIPSMFLLVKNLFAWAGDVMEQVAELFPEKQRVEATVPPTTEEIATGEGMDYLKDQQQSHQTSQFTFAVMAVIAVGFMVPAACLALYKIGKALWRLARRFVEKVMEGAATVTDEFVDEITDTRKDNPEYLREVTKGKKWDIVHRGTPKEQIRHHYKRLQTRHPKWHQSSTARENLSEEAAALYEKARYSDHPVTAREAEEFKNKAK